MILDRQSLPVNSHRVLFGLSKIGYTPTSAICDIVDNAVVAGAKNIYIQIVKEEKRFNDSKANNIKEYLIIDDGHGMDDDGIINALSLGSNGNGYDPNSLSKFGLGLKSASFAQGNRLEIISGTKAGDFCKHSVDLDEIADEYSSLKEALSEDDKTIIASYLPEHRGTIIRISKIHKNNHPSVKKTREDLRKTLGITYYYFMKENDLNIRLDSEAMEPYDVLFVDEANQNGDLNENTWDGRTVQWILRPENFAIDGENGVTCKIEATQLPYPPIFQLEGLTKQEIHDKYNISGKNYGFYVYRNKRLISWAEKFGGIIPFDKDRALYAFRGRILINSNADAAFNIDVKKSNISLSDEAETTISDVADPLKRKSKLAWEHAGKLYKSFTAENPDEIVNNMANALGGFETLPGDISTPEEEFEQQQRAKAIVDDSKKKAIEQTKKRLGRKPGQDAETPSDEEIEKTIRGNNEETAKILKVESLDDNLLWEPYFDASKGHCVRINKNHRFARLIYEDNSDNADMQIIFGLLLLHFVEADFYVRTTIKDQKRSTIESVIWEYRRAISEILAALCRNKNITLPPNSGVGQ